MVRHCQTASQRQHGNDPGEKWMTLKPPCAEQDLENGAQVYTESPASARKLFLALTSRSKPSAGKERQEADLRLNLMWLRVVR